MTSQELVQRQRDLVAFADDAKLRAELAEILPPDSVSVAVFIRGLKNAALTNPDIVKADHASLYRAVLRAGMDGLVPDGREAAIVVMGGKAAYMPMVGGLRKTLAEFGWSLRTAVIYENDEFEDISDEGRVVHRRPRPGVDRGAPVGAYAMAVHKDGRTEAEVYSKQQIEEVRDKTARSKNIWNTWPDQMWEKTPAHRLAKKMPLDPKDRERMDSILSEDLNGSEMIEVLYGTQDRPKDLPPIQADEGPGESAAAPSDSPAPPADFDGEEPVEVVEAEVVEETIPVFKTGKHIGKTVQQVWDEGEAGQGYIRWARKNWKSSEIVAALETFAQDHPEVDA